MRPDGATVQLGAERPEEGEEWQGVLSLSASSRRSQSGRGHNIRLSYWSTTVLAGGSPTNRGAGQQNTFGLLIIFFIIMQQWSMVMLPFG